MVGGVTRQGCPLSARLFSLMMEPIAVALRASSLMKGVQVCNLVKKASLYVNYVVLFLNDPATSLLLALYILDHVATFSGLHVNWHTSTVLPLGKGVYHPSTLSTALQWVSKYLGLTITNSVLDFIWLNITPIIYIFV